MEFEKVKINKNGEYYWTWRDIHFMPYAWLYKKDLKSLPRPFFLEDIHPDCPIGFLNFRPDALTNIIELPGQFDRLKLDSSLRKDLKRVEKKNERTLVVINEKNALESSKKWFLELWKENKKDFLLGVPGEGVEPSSR